MGGVEMEEKGTLEHRDEDETGSGQEMDTGTGRLVGIGLSVLWYRVIVQRKHRVAISDLILTRLVPQSSRSSPVLLADTVFISYTSYDLDVSPE